MNTEIALGLILSQLFFSLKSADFLSTQVEKAPLLEQVANYTLLPYQLVFNGQTATIEGDQVTFSPTFLIEHPDHFKEMCKYGAALLTAVPSAACGALFKGISFCLFSETRETRRLIELSKITPQEIESKAALLLGREESSLYSDEFAPCGHVPRPPHLTPQQQIETDAMHTIMSLLEREKIPCWVDGGTCLGAYRHGGMIPWDFDVDLSILRCDFDSAFEALKLLDPEEFQIQNWSGRDTPKGLLKVYVRKSRSAIDLYTYDVDLERQEVRYLFALEHSPYLPKKWKVREQPFKTPVPLSTLFPLKKAFFEGREVRVPHDIVAWLQSKYGENLSPARVWSDELQDYQKIEGHPYWKQSHI